MIPVVLISFCPTPSALPSVPSGEVEVRTVDDARVRGEIVGLDGDRLVLRTAEGRAEAPCREILSASFIAPPKVRREFPSLLQLSNGDRLFGAVETGKGDRLRFRPGGRDPIELPVAAIRRFVNLERARDRDPEEFVGAPEGDRLYLPAPGGLDHLNGTFASFDGDGVLFESALGRSRKSLADLVALVLAPEEPSRSDERLLALLDLADGSRMTGALTGFGEGAFEVALQVGPSLKVALDNLVAFTFRNGRYVYLSELEPAETTETPYFGGPDAMHFPPRRDRSVGGGPLRCGGKEFARGLGLHSRTVLRYLLGGKYSRFRAAVGIDDEVREFAFSGSAILRVFADGKLAFESPPLRAGEEPVRIPDVDLKGVREVRVEADYGEDFHIGDRVDLLDPVLIGE